MTSVVDLMESVKNINDPNVVKVLVNNNGEGIPFPRSVVPFYSDRTPVDRPVKAYNRHIRIDAYRTSVLKQLASKS